jgi:hypothetical protein
MPIHFACPICSKGYSVPDANAGKWTKCRVCGERLSVPLTGEEQNAELEARREAVAAIQASPASSVPAEQKKPAASEAAWSRAVGAWCRKRPLHAACLSLGVLALTVFLVHATVDRGVSHTSTAPSPLPTPPVTQQRQAAPDQAGREQQHREATRREQLIIAIARRRAKAEDDLLRSKYELEKHLHDSREQNRSASADFEGRVYIARPFRPFVSQEAALFEKCLHESRRDYGKLDLKLLEEAAAP